MTEYNANELIFKIKTPSPEANHFLIMRAIAASMRWAADAVKTSEDCDNIICLAQFFEEILPDEYQLKHK